MPAGCGQHKRTADTACAGLPTAAHPPKRIALFGALDRWTRKRMCGEIGRPDQVADHGRRETWTYGDTRFTYDAQLDGVVAVR